MKQLSYIYTYMSSLLDFPPTPSHSSRSSQSTELSSLYYSFPLAVSPIIVHMSVLISQFMPHSPSPHVSTYTVSTSESLFLPWKQMRVWSVAQSCLTLCNPMGCCLPDSSVHGIFQAQILEWVAISSSQGSFAPRDQTCISCIGRHIICATGETQKQVHLYYFSRVICRDMDGSKALLFLSNKYFVGWQLYCISRCIFGRIMNIRILQFIC